MIKVGDVVRPSLPGRLAGLAARGVVAELRRDRFADMARIGEAWIDVDWLEPVALSRMEPGHSTNGGAPCA